MGTRSGWDGCGKSRRYPDSIRGPCFPYLAAIPTELSPEVSFVFRDIHKALCSEPHQSVRILSGF
jgi:hypothetical protein